MKNKFLGRDKEINHLYEAFNYVAQKNTEGLYSGPRIVSIISESGLGKSRLVQELYCRIANTELYNPSAFNYWPKEFNDNDVNLQVTPKMDLQNPNGPPKFLWVGARWPPVNERNQASRDSVFPEIKQDLSIHESIIRKMSPAWLEFWNRTTSVIKADFPGEIRGQVTGDIIKFALDMSVPFSGLISGVIKNTVEMAIDRSQAKEDYTAIKEAKSKDEVEEMLGIFTKLLSDKHAIPIVLWLDDAHWADDLMQSFIHRLVFKAKEKKWPLLVVITHWLREYKEQITEINPTALSNIIKYHPNDYIELAKIDHSCLVTYVNENLPGITQSQMDLLCDKCDGNFLSMVENVGLLLSQPRYFNNRDITSYINDTGIEKITHWESDRQRRVKQRFDSLEPMALQDALALGADQGVRFLPELIIRHLENEGIELSDGMTDFDKCIVPFSIITKHDGSPDIREFRDKLYLKVSLAHFGEFHKNDIDANSSISKWDVLVKQWLTQQINDCFDSAGNIIETAEQKLYFINGTQQEMHAILALGLNKLDLSCPSDLSIRFTCLLAHARSKEQAWSAIARDSGYVKAWNDNAANFNNVVSEYVISNTADSFVMAGAYFAALPFKTYQFSLHKINVEQIDTPNSQRLRAVCLHELSEIHQNVGDLAEALNLKLECLIILKKCAEQFEAPIIYKDIASELHSLCRIYRDLGNLSEALNYCLESLTISKKLAEQLNTPQNQREISVSLNSLSIIHTDLGKYSEALGYSMESLAISKTIATSLNTLESHRDVAISLSDLSRILNIQDNFSGALKYKQESLDIFRRLAEQLDTPGSYQDLGDLLTGISAIQYNLKNLPEALKYGLESLSLHKKLVELLDTPKSYQNQSVCLSFISLIQHENGNLSEALEYALESYAIAKKIADKIDTPQNNRSLAASLHNLSHLQFDIGNLSEALIYCRESLTITKKLAEQLDTPQNYEDLRQSLFHISKIHENLNNLSEALNFGLESYAIAKKIAEQIDTTDSHQNTAFNLNHLSRIQASLENLPGALLLRMESLSIQKKLEERLGDLESKKDISRSLYAIYCFHRDIGNLSEALTFGYECLAIEKKVSELSETPECQRDITFTLNDLSYIHVNLKNLPEAYKLRFESLKIQKILVEQFDTPESHRDIAVSLTHLSRIQIELGNSREARAFGNESLAIARRLAEQLDTPESHDFVNEIETFIDSI